MQQIKLVIWDLDETFWQGTLSEGPIQYLSKNHNIVVELTRRGIVNSICSKNTFNEAKVCLEQHGIWDYFIFPKIDWQPKGQMISAIIDEMQLRPPNVLFIDDNHLNLEEAKYFCPELQTAGPDIIETLLDLEACRGKDDSSLSRLKQYKLLAQKTADQKTAQGSNEDFLRSCAIVARVGHDCTANRDRILELINRTNQLNYTKHRLTETEIDALLADSTFEKGYVQVSDHYGDYGICGFYAKSGQRLEHFVFTCRILNMGVENWLFRKLGSPLLEISGEVVTPLDPGMEINWIREADEEAQTKAEAAPPEGSRHGISIMVKGGCDFLQIKNYLVRGSRFEAEVNYVSAKGLMVENSHTELLKRSGSETLALYGDVIDRLPFFDRGAFVTNFFSNRHDVYIYGVLDDYSRGLYRYKNTDFIIPFDDIDLDATRRENWPMHLQRTEKNRLDGSFLEWFSANFEFLGAADADSFTRNIKWLCDRISREKLLIILNGSEVAYHPCSENNRWEHHKKMNAALESAVRGRPNVVICDIREFLATPEDHRHNIRHYNRKVYFQIAQKINEIIESRCDVSLGFWQKQWNFFKVSKKRVRKYLKKNIRQALRQAIPKAGIVSFISLFSAAAEDCPLFFTAAFLRALFRPKRIYYIEQDEPLLKRLHYKVRSNALPVCDFPEDILFETVSGCNAHCAFCPNGNGLSKVPRGRMEWALFKKIADESLDHHAKRISPYLMNEPLLDRDIGKKIRYIADNRKKGISIKMNTNAGLLDEEMGRSLAQSGLDRLNISCHGISKQAYEESMLGLKLETTLANIDRFLALLKENGGKGPKVAVTMVKTKLIAQELPQIRAYWRERNVSVHIRQLENRSSDAIAGRGLEPASWSRFSWCKRLFTQACILTNGDMVLCCVDYGCTTVLGNVEKQSIKEIWNSDKAIDLRRSFLKGHTEGLLCHSCLKQPTI